MLRFLPIILGVVVTIYALIDCVRYEEEPLPGGVPKPLWVVLILVLLPVGGIAWLVVSRVSAAGAPREAGTSGPSLRSPTRPARRPRPMAPDDDPEFLASLGRAITPPDPAPGQPTGPSGHRDAPQDPAAGEEREGGDEPDAGGDHDGPHRSGPDGHEGGGSDAGGGGRSSRA